MLVNQVKHTFTGRLNSEKKELDERKRDRTKRQERTIGEQRQREVERQKWAEAQKHTYCEIKRLTIRGEESSKLITDLKNNIEYQRKMESTRNDMLREKGRLLKQLICREQL